MPVWLYAIGGTPRASLLVWVSPMFGAPAAQRLCAAPVGLEHGHRTGALTSSVVVVPVNPHGQILEGIWKWWSSGGRSKGSISVSFKGRKSPYLGSSLTRGLAGGSTCSERSDCCWRKQQPACRGVGSAERPTKRCPAIPPVFPPPLHIRTPEELLDEVRSGPADYAPRRVVAIGAAQEVLAKRLGQLAAIDRQLSVLFLRRAEVQTRCQT